LGFISFFRADISIRHGSALLLILSTFYITPIFYIWEKISKNLSIPILISILLFVDDSLLISQEKFSKNQIQIFFVAIVLFLLFSDNLGLSYSMTSLKFFISPELQRILILPL